ncbi:MAG TPA: tetratricopeptide repeat protein [Candidatus Brocadiia bacterium]|nr:tetratricopeptide repeat protein [Candidatus Brocadiia bacterium]
MAQTAPNAPGAANNAPASLPAAPTAAPASAADTPAAAPSTPAYESKTAQWQKELEELERLKETYRKIEEQRAQLNKITVANSAAPSAPGPAARPEAKPEAKPGAKPAAPAPAPEKPQVEIPAIDTQRIVSGSEEKLANALYLLGRYAEALDAYERAASNTQDAESQSWIMYQSGMCSLRLGHAEQALEKLGQAISKRPDSIWAKQAQWQVNAMRWSARWPSRIVP